MICLQVISNAGEARSQCMCALESARNGRFEEAESYFNESLERLQAAHHIHTGLITKEARGELQRIGLILVHSEDILMGAEITSALAREMVELYKR
ncbi:phosphotransferase system PTS lactose/cellobiose-specific IIA subunit [[Clostridium] saccharolyticum WM1]|uniref:Phosphotransferase system PTS lactose/cellobiose-specific IIA subunit n=2 Tax=Lacrimispora TaxID=2719231 RepID=D9RAV8_LACSW|nr:phosphotransferase system PTS lactose/cellobiose-specific IIA subunit [[Clostridium] saccharolyticum WM1]